MSYLAACSIWKPQCKAVLDIRVVDTDAYSYHSLALQNVLWTAKMDKHEKSLQACHDRCASLTPICVSMDGLLGKEIDFLITLSSDFASIKRKRPYSLLMNWIKVCLSFAIFCHLQFCGRYFNLRVNCITDDASLPLTFH